MPGPFSAPFQNVTVTKSVPVSETPNISTNGHAGPAGEVQGRTIPVSPVTQYNDETGLVEPVKDFFGKGTTQKVVPEKSAAKPAAKPGEKPATRHEKYLAEKDANQEQRDAAATHRAKEKQALARDFLKKGDMVGFAESLGIPISEARDLVTKALVGLPTQDKQLTPEEQRAADETAFRAEQKKFREEQEAFRFNVLAQQYVDKKISPVLADKDKYEFIAQANAENAITASIYNFINEHFTKTKAETGTGVELSVSDVADEIEAQLEKAFVSSIEKGKKLKKMQKLFGQTQAQEEEPVLEAALEEPVLEEPAEDLNEEPIAAASFGRRNGFTREARREEPVFRAPPQRQNGTSVPFALLSREERQAIMRKEQDAARSRR